ncbi:uncharacterized protein [Littorina saxatilis]|uniref:Uncharacterized protein n=1 Tax=Littorina saxatilis TaxID=31220 RepID=A0AAN9G4A2_9CAEN
MRTSLYCGKLARLVVVLSVTVIYLYHTQWWTLLLPVQNAAPTLAPIASVTALRHMTSSHNAFIQRKPSQGAYKEDNVTALSKPSQGTHKEDNVTAGAKSSQPPLATDRYIIYYCKGACGGWADRLKGIAIAYVIANLTHRRFGIKIPDIPCPLREFLLPAEVPWDLPDSLDLQSDAKMYSRLDSVAFYKSMPSVNFSEVFTARVALFKANLDYFDLLKQNALYERQLQWMRPLTNDQIFARIFHQLFRPAPRVARALQSVLASAKPSPDHRLLCAHVRFASNSEVLRDTTRRHTTAHGHTVLHFLHSLDPASPLYNVTTATAALPTSYATITADLPLSYAFANAALPPSYAFANAALPPSRAKADNYRFFVTSDSQVYIDQAGEVFGARFVRTSGQFVHVDRKGGQRGQEVCEGFTKVLVDQLLLARCDVLVVSMSGLSRQAAYIRGTDSGLYCILMTGQLVQCQPSHLRQLYHVMG